MSGVLPLLPLYAFITWRVYEECTFFLYVYCGAFNLDGYKRFGHVCCLHDQGVNSAVVSCRMWEQQLMQRSSGGARRSARLCSDVDSILCKLMVGLIGVAVTAQICLHSVAI